MKPETYDKLIFLTLGIFIGAVLIIVFSFIFTSQNIPEKENFGEEIANSEKKIIENCKNLSLIDSAFCLRNSLKPIYFYNITDDEKARDMSFEEIKKVGTDCTGWAYLYMRLGRALNFNVTTVRNGGISGLYSAHRYAVMWDDGGFYCKLDMMSVNCKEIK